MILVNWSTGWCTPAPSAVSHTLTTGSLVPGLATLLSVCQTPGSADPSSSSPEHWQPVSSSSSLTLEHQLSLTCCLRSLYQTHVSSVYHCLFYVWLSLIFLSYWDLQGEHQSVMMMLMMMILMMVETVLEDTDHWWCRVEREEETVSDDQDDEDSWLEAETKHSWKSRNKKWSNNFCRGRCKIC